MHARITGTVFGLTKRGGTSKASGNTYSMAIAKVLVQHGNEASLVEVTVDLLADDAPLHLPTSGEVVDLLVQVSTYRDAPSFRFVCGWDDAKVPALGGVPA